LGISDFGCFNIRVEAFPSLLSKLWGLANAPLVFVNQLFKKFGNLSTRLLVILTSLV
jgi:hypothetical protein